MISASCSSVSDFVRNAPRRSTATAHLLQIQMHVADRARTLTDGRRDTLHRRPADVRERRSRVIASSTVTALPTLRMIGRAMGHPVVRKLSPLHAVSESHSENDLAAFSARPLWNSRGTGECERPRHPARGCAQSSSPDLPRLSLPRSSLDSCPEGVCRPPVDA